MKKKKKGGYMEKSELVLMELKNYEKQWKRILEQLVIERVKDNPSDKLVLEEIMEQSLLKMMRLYQQVMLVLQEEEKIAVK